MPTPIISSPNVCDLVLTQLLSVAAVSAVFTVTTLTGVLTNRFKASIALLQVTPANVQVKDENGDLLMVSFLSANPSQFVYTQKGVARLELELSRSTGY